MSDARCKDALQIRAPDGSLVVRLRGVALGRLRRVIVVPEDTRPLLAGFVVILRVESGIHAAVVDLHAGPWPGIPRVHCFGDTAPDLWGADDVALGAAAVPGVDLVGGGVETAGGDAGVDCRGGEKFGVCGGHDVLSFGLVCMWSALILA